jgi:hypothetical protein
MILEQQSHGLDRSIALRPDAGGIVQIEHRQTPNCMLQFNVLAHADCEFCRVRILPVLELLSPMLMGATD